MLCSTLIYSLLLSQTISPTFYPTVSPTEYPTESPTEQPTESPWVVFLVHTDAPVNCSFCTHFISSYTELYHITQQSQVNQHFHPIEHMTQLKVLLRNHHMNQLISQQRNRRLRVVREVRPCSTNQTRMVGTSLTRQNGMIRVGNAWTVSSFDSDGTFGTHL